MAETLVDLGSGLAARFATNRRMQLLRPDELVELALEDALRRGMATVEELTDLIARRGPATPGPAVLKTVLDRRALRSPATESYLETRAVQVLRNGGLPDFERQVEIVHEGKLMRVDLMRGIAVVELDGFGPHQPEFVADRQRWNLVDEAGFPLRVFTWEDIEHEPETVVRRVRRLLDRVEALPLYGA